MLCSAEEVIERLTDAILGTGHRDALSRAQDIVQSWMHVRHRLEELLAELTETMKRVIPDELQARASWYLAGPEAVIAVAPTEFDMDFIANNLTTPLLLVQTVRDVFKPFLCERQNLSIHLRLVYGIDQGTGPARDKTKALCSKVDHKRHVSYSLFRANWHLNSFIVAC